jgi:hypothetical protein
MQTHEYIVLHLKEEVIFFDLENVQFHWKVEVFTVIFKNKSHN